MSPIKNKKIDGGNRKRNVLLLLNADVRCKITISSGQNEWKERDGKRN